MTTGVFIKGMKMPENCWECPFFIKSDSPKHPFVDCKLIGQLGDVLNFSAGIPIDCPLEEMRALEIKNPFPDASKIPVHSTVFEEE